MSVATIPRLVFSFLVSTTQAVVLDSGLSNGLARQPQTCDAPLFSENVADAVWRWAQEDTENQAYWSRPKVGREQHPLAGKKAWIDKEFELAAVAPHGHTGARGPLRRALLRWMQGEPLSITVLGNSMTVGVDAFSPAWTTRLERILQGWVTDSAPTFGKVKVTSKAQGGLGSSTLLSMWSVWVDAFKTADLVIVDYACTDAYGETTRKATDGLVRRLLALRNKPAVMYLETWPHAPDDNLMGAMEKAFKVGYHDPLMKYRAMPLQVNCTTTGDVSKYPHWPSLTRLGVPVVSYSDVVCASGSTWWMEDPELPLPHSANPDSATRPAVDSVQETQSPHPLGVPTHELVAELMASVLLHDARVVCTDADMILASAPALPRYGTGAEQAAVAWSDPPLVLEDTNMMYCGEDPKTSYSAYLGAEGFPAVADNGWRFALDDRDRPGAISEELLATMNISQALAQGAKPGWIASEGVPAQIEFRAQLGKWRILTLEYLRSYKGVGKLTCTWTIDDAQDTYTAEIDGLWGSRSSLSSVFQFPVQVKRGRPLVHLKCVTDGHKFKIMSLTGC